MVTPPRGGVRAVTFDLDFTLWDLTDVIRRADERQYDFLASVCPTVAERYRADDLHALRMAVYEERPDLRHDVTALRIEVLRRLGAECGFDDEAGQRAFEIFLDARHEVTLYEDTIPLLDSLREHYVVGAMTNGNADVGRIGLSHHFDFALSAIDVGAAKPDRIIFEAACHRAGVPAHQIVHVGDEPGSDVVGAARYGMVPVWLNRAREPWPADLEPVEHIELDSLEALGALLEDWRCAGHEPRV